MDRKAFTLIEIMIVLAVIGILVAVSLPNFNRFTIANKTAKAKSGLGALQMAVEDYYLNNNNLYPSSLADLTTASPVIIRTLPGDPFTASGQVYGYDRSSNAKYYVIYSIGPGGNGSASVSDAGTLTEQEGGSCIYVSNVQEDDQP